VRISRSRFLVAVAAGLLPIGLGGLFGCGSKPPDGMLEEVSQVSDEQQAEVKAQYQNRLAKKKQSMKKGKSSGKR
jgi:hypothetical protein